MYCFDNLGYAIEGTQIEYNDIEAVKILMASDASVNKPTYQCPYFSTGAKQSMPLDLALRKQGTAIADFLIEHGARMN